MTLALNALTAPLLSAAAAGGPPSTALPADPTVLQNLEFQFVGFIIVLGTLACLWLICELTGALFRAQAARQVRLAAAANVERLAAESVAQASPAAPATGVAPVAPAAGSEPGADLDIPFAVIAAAVAAVIHEPYRIVAVQPASGTMAWSIEGRRQHFASHLLQRR